MAERPRPEPELSTRVTLVRLAVFLGTLLFGFAWGVAIGQKRVDLAKFFEGVRVGKEMTCWATCQDLSGTVDTASPDYPEAHLDAICLCKF